MSKARAKRIKIIFFDVDGVMTDGTLFFIPQPGGHGAARDAVEYILRGQGRLKAVMEKYLSTHSGFAAGN